jgi:hypothetical protein
MARAVYISYCSGDKQFAIDLCMSLERRRLDCWIAPRDIVAGQPYGLSCLQGIGHCPHFLLVASKNALASVQVLSEVEQAHKRGRPIYTLLFPDAKVSGEIDFYISRLHWMQCDGRSAEETAAKLAPVLHGSCNWSEIASPPTLRRTMQYRPVAFLKLIAALGRLRAGA